jgi:hypothetical protein
MRKCEFRSCARWTALAAGVAIALLLTADSVSALPKREPTAEELAGWPVDVKGHVAVKPGEHPRLLFRRTDIDRLREKAKTPEGQAMIRRLRKQLNGSDGESMPANFVQRGARDAADGALDTYTFSHAAGFGLLYQLTGDKKYADLGKQCMEKAFEGVMDRDTRYSFRKPSGALRSGPVLGWTALGYDLCYDGWDEAFRRKAADELQNYNEAQWMSLPELTRGERQHPGSNHWGMQVGGAAMALLAIMNDPGVDMDKINPLLETSQKSMKINLTQGFGDGGFYVEGDGTGSMSSHIAFLTGLQAWKTAAGKDFYSPKPNAQWTSLKWFFLTALGGDPSNLRASFPDRGEYPHNIWSRAGISGGCYFGIGMGVATEEQKPALLWFYNHSGVREADQKGGFGIDAPGPYPHHSVVSFVNWPVGMQEKNPGEVIPHAYRDSICKFYAWRNRWQDADDVIVSILTHATKGNMGSKAENTLTIQTGGRKSKWGTISGGFTGEFAPKPDGSTILTTGDGSCLAIDFSGVSGAAAMLVMTGPGAPAGTVVQAGGASFSFLFPAKGGAPTPQAQGDKVAVGGQTVSLDGKKIVLAK